MQLELSHVTVPWNLSYHSTVELELSQYRGTWAITRDSTVELELSQYRGAWAITVLWNLSYHCTVELELSQYRGTWAITVPWNLRYPTHEFCDILCHPTNISIPKVFLLTKIKREYSDILYNTTHLPGSLVCRIRQVPL